MALFKAFFCVFAALFLTGILFAEGAAGSKIVLIGDKAVSDLVAAEMSSDENLCFVERNEIEKILREHKLAMTSMAGSDAVKLFPHADIIVLISSTKAGNGMKPSSVVIFNAKNGFRLAKEFLPQDNIQARNSIIAFLRKSISKYVSPDSIFLSSGIVRNAGIPERQKYKMAEIAFILYERLGKADHIQIMERDDLGVVLDERKLSEAEFRLNPSTHIINMEFSPGSEADKIDLILSLADSSGKKLFHKKYIDIQSADTAFAELCEALNTVSSSAPFNPADEARHYYNETQSYLNGLNFCFPSDWDSNYGAKVNAMVALAPNVDKYRYEEVLYHLERVMMPLPWQEKIKIYRRFIVEARQFYADFPSFRHPGNMGFVNQRGRNSNPAWDTLHTFNVFGKLSSNASEEECKAYSEVSDEIRAFARWEMLLCDFKGFNPDAPVKDERQLYRLNYWLFNGGLRVGLYCDDLKMIRDNFTALQTYVKAIDAFFKENPEGRKKSVICESLFPHWSCFICIYRKEEAYKEMERLLNSAEFAEVEKTIREINFDNLTVWLPLWQAMREYFASDRSEAAIRECVFRFMRNIEKETCMKVALDKPDKILSMESQVLGVFRDILPRKIGEKSSRFLIEQWKNEYIASKTGMAPEEKFELVLSSFELDPLGHLDEISAQAPQIRKMALQMMCSNATNGSIVRIAYALWKALDANPKARAALELLNSGFEIKKINTPYKLCIASTEVGGKIYMLNSSEEEQIYLTEFEPNTESVRTLEKSGLATRMFQNEQRIFGGGNSSTLSHAGDYLVAGGLSMMALYNLKTGKWSFIKDLPGRFVVSAKMMRGRLYYVCGGEAMFVAGEKMLSMHSCMPDGNDRKTHFSGERANKENELDSLEIGKVSELIDTGDGRLVFAVNSWSGNYERIYSFDTATESFSRVLDLPKASHYVSLRDVGGQIVGQGGRGFGPAFFTMDRKSLKIEWFFVQNKDEKMTVKYRIPGNQELRAPFLIAKDRYFVSGGYCSTFFLDLEQPDKTPMLLLPMTSNVFYLPEKDEYVFPGYHTGGVFLVKLTVQSPNKARK